MEPTKSIFELNLTIYYTYLCTQFGVNRIEIATSSVDTYTHIQEIFPAVRSVENYGSQVFKTFRLEMAA